MTKFSAGLLLALATLASAQAQAPMGSDHGAHHPGQAAAAAPSPGMTPYPPNAETMQNMDAQMQAMRDMHQKMIEAKTPEARQALMDEHMKTMQGGMQMIGMMRGQMAEGAPASMPDMQRHNQWMEKRMDMMESMMQMMMDRMPMPPASAPSRPAAK
ncbi:MULTISPECIES: hypothetical protein [unclassified Diaphorobacter]|uniref:hypothetical protein n=1 Tax=unclassified Diaphorobacter TaxID=2649760 RepID=UPI001FF0D1C1|nr:MULTISPECIES: hypothetical protein [unclassified Diaphorobacter]